jgi:hypothetical protein
MNKNFSRGFIRSKQYWKVLCAIAVVTLFSASFSAIARAQDQDQQGQDRDDPPGRVARLGHMEGSVSFQPAGESEWVEAVQNRPMTTGDKLWADRDSRAEVQLGSSTIDLAPNTGFSFLNLDDRTVQIQLSAGTVNVRVYELDRDTDYEIDTPNQAFVIAQPGRYRVESSENGDYTVVTIREGEGQSTGNGQSYTIHQGQRVTFRGTNSLNAEVDQIGDQDQFDRWSYDRERRYEDSPSARYCSRQVVGFEDLDEYGDWRPAPDYGYVWYPRVDAGWAPYHYGHWAWIDPWGWTWVDDANWGYAPFHYGRWAVIAGRWGWVPGPREVRPVYAPALVAFVGGVGVGAVGGNVAWFPLGPREVYVPSYRVSRGYVNRVNVTNTTVNVTQVTNVYNTTIVNNNTTINNVTYVNRNVRGGVTAMPQNAFASAQPVSRTAVVVNESQLRRSPVTMRAAVPPARQAVLGVHANTVNRVAAPPANVVSRPVIAKNTPPPAAPSFAARQQVLERNPGVPMARPQMQQMHAANPPASAPRVVTAPPAKPEPLPEARNRPGNQPNMRPGNPPANGRPGMNQPAGRPEPTNPAAPNNRPEPNQPGNRPQPNQPENRPQPNQPENRPQPGANRPFEPPARNDRPPSAQPNNRPEPNEPNNRPQPNQPQPNRPEANQPNPGYRPQPNQPSPNNRPDNRPAEPPARNDRSPAAQPNRQEPNNAPPAYNRPDMNRPAEPPAREEHPSTVPPNAPPANRPESNQPRPETNRPPQRNESAPPPRNEPAPRPQSQPAPQSERPQAHPPAENRPAPPPQQREPNKSQKQDDKHKPQ